MKIEGIPLLSRLFGRRPDADRRGAEDRRPPAGGPEASRGRDPGYVKATELTTEPIRLRELAARSGISLDRLRRAAFGKEKLSAEERAVLMGRSDDQAS